MRVLAILAGSVLISVLLFLTRPETHAGLKPVSPQYVATVAVVETDIQSSVTIAGKLQPVRTVTVPFEVSGRITSRNAEPGQQASPGDVLLEIDRGDYADSVAENSAALQLEISAIRRDQALLELAEQELQILQRELERLASLEQRSLASQSGYDEAQKKILQQQERQASLRHSVDSAMSRKARIQASLNRAARNLERTRLVAGFPALVNRVSAEVGDYVERGQKVIELIQIDELDVYLEVSGRIAAFLRLEQRVPVYAAGNTYTGRIVAVSISPDPSTNTHAVRVRLDKHELFPGNIVRVKLPGEYYAGAKVIPASALLRDAGENYVYTVSDNTLSRVRVSLVASVGDTHIIEGVSAGTVIAAADVTAYKHGHKIDPEPYQAR